MFTQRSHKDLKKVGRSPKKWSRF